MKNKLILIFLGLLLLLPSFINAEQQTLGTFQQNKCVNLIQTCANCTYVNISSILYPNSSQATSELEMTKVGTVYNYTFCSTSAIGSYIVNGFGDPDTVKSNWVYDFYISPNGETSTSATAFFYIGAIILLIFLIIISIMGFIKVESLWVKYTLFCTVYLLLSSTIFIVMRMAQGFMYDSSYLISFLEIIFNLSMWLFFPFLMVSFLFILYKIYTIKEIQRLVDKGIPYDEALERTNNRRKKK